MVDETCGYDYEILSRHDAFFPSIHFIHSFHSIEYISLLSHLFNHSFMKGYSLTHRQLPSYPKKTPPPHLSLPLSSIQSDLPINKQTKHTISAINFPPLPAPSHHTTKIFLDLLLFISSFLSFFLLSTLLTLYLPPPTTNILTLLLIPLPLPLRPKHLR